METQSASLTADTTPGIQTDGDGVKFLPLDRGVGRAGVEAISNTLLDTQWESFPEFTAFQEASGNDKLRAMNQVRVRLQADFPAEYEALRNELGDLLTNGQGFFTDAQMDAVLTKFLGGSDSGRIVLGSGPVGIEMGYTPHNWFAGLGDEKTKALLATLGAGLSAEPGGGSFLSDISELIGTVSSAYATYKVAT